MCMFCCSVVLCYRDRNLLPPTVLAHTKPIPIDPEITGVVLHNKMDTDEWVTCENDEDAEAYRLMRAKPIMQLPSAPSMPTVDSDPK